MHIDYTPRGRYGVAIIKAPKILGNRLGASFNGKRFVMGNP
jgi:hypothetical protein